MKAKKIKKGILILLSLGAFTGLICWGANRLIEYKTARFIYNNINDIPENKVGLVLGANKHAYGGINPYFTYRIKAAADLYHAGKVRYLVVSGDNSVTHYNEPEDMKQALMEAGVPEEAIYLDYAGFRTLDSVVRMNKIFGQSKFTIISQPFHNERAIYIAHHYGYETVGYNARDVGRRMGLKVRIREYFARVKVFVDFVTFKKPKFLGEPVPIG